MMMAEVLKITKNTVHILQNAKMTSNGRNGRQETNHLQAQFFILFHTVRKPISQLYTTTILIDYLFSTQIVEY